MLLRLIKLKTHLVLIDISLPIENGDYFLLGEKHINLNKSGRTRYRTPLVAKIVGWRKLKMGTFDLTGVPELPEPPNTDRSPIAFIPELYGCNGSCGICDASCDIPIVKDFILQGKYKY